MAKDLAGATTTTTFASIICSVSDSLTESIAFSDGFSDMSEIFPVPPPKSRGIAPRFRMFEPGRGPKI